MFSNIRHTALGVVLALLASGLFFAAYATAEGASDDAVLKSRFDLLSQHGNVECSAKFEASIASMPPDARLQGSCCAPMDETRYRQQIEGLKSTPTLPKYRPTLTTFPRPWPTSSWATTTSPSTRKSRRPTTTPWSTPICRVRAAASAGDGRCMAGSVSTLSAYAPLYRPTARGPVERRPRLRRGN